MPKQFCGVDGFMHHHGPRPGRTLVAGSRVYEKKQVDRRDLYVKAVGVDMLPGPGVDVVHNLEAPLPVDLGLFDHIDCVSMLEHCQRPWLVAENLRRAMAPGASILVSAPFVWRVHGYPSDYWRYTVESFVVLFPDITWRERGYLVAGALHKITPSLDHKGNPYLQRSEAVGFGLLFS